MESHVFVQMEGKLLSVSYKMGKSFIVEFSWAQIVTFNLNKIKDATEEIDDLKEKRLNLRNAKKKSLDEEIRNKEKFITAATENLNNKHSCVVDTELYKYELYTHDYVKLDWNAPLDENVVKTAISPKTALIVCEQSKLSLSAFFQCKISLPISVITTAKG